MSSRSIHSLQLAVALASTLGVVGCEDRTAPADRNPNTTSPNTTPANPAPTTPSNTNPAPMNPTPGNTGTSKAPADTMPDNTGRNDRDRDANNATPPDQGESESDRRITADIRKAILAEKGMSINAQNCKVITRNSIVTLRGPVSSQAEKDMIAEKARGVSGVASVVNELEIAPPR